MSFLDQVKPIECGFCLGRGCTICYSRRINELEGKVEKYKAAYVKLTNCDQYGDDSEIKGHYCPSRLLSEFDDIKG